jgi:hypothetical protein
MTALKCLTAATAALALSLSAAAACDYADSMTTAEAEKGSQVAQSAPAQSAPSATVAPYTPVPAEPTSVAAAEAKTAPDTAGGIARQ